MPDRSVDTGAGGGAEEATVAVELGVVVALDKAVLMALLTEDAVAGLVLLLQPEANPIDTAKAAMIVAGRGRRFRFIGFL